MKLTHTGQQAVALESVGEWNPGESKDVPEDLGRRLLKRPDFTKTPTTKPARATAKAKSTTN
jgi:hypothetical protein